MIQTRSNVFNYNVIFFGEHPTIFGIKWYNWGKFWNLEYIPISSTNWVNLADEFGYFNTQSFPSKRIMVDCPEKDILIKKSLNRKKLNDVLLWTKELFTVIEKCFLLKHL